MNANKSLPARLLPRKSNFLARLATVAVAASVITGLMPAQAALDTNITGIVTDLTTFFTSIQGLIITVVVFGLAIGYAKMLRRK